MDKGGEGSVLVEEKLFVQRKDQSYHAVRTPPPRCSKDCARGNEYHVGKGT